MSTNTAKQRFEFDGTAGGLIEVLSRYPAGTKVALEDMDGTQFVLWAVQEALSAPLPGSTVGQLEDAEDGELTLFIC